MAELLQLKCLSDVQKLISDIEVYRARPVIEGKHPTLYDQRLDGKYRTIMGVRICDYQFALMKNGFFQTLIWGCLFRLHGII